MCSSQSPTICCLLLCTQAKRSHSTQPQTIFPCTSLFPVHSCSGLSHPLSHLFSVSFFTPFLALLHTQIVSRGCLNIPLFQFPGSTRLQGSFPDLPIAQICTFHPSRSRHTRMFQTRSEMPQVTFHLQLGVTGRESPTTGLGHSPLVPSGQHYTNPTQIPFRPGPLSCSKPQESPSCLRIYSTRTCHSQ